ncbi:MAG: U32 family peptidase [Gemmatimonadaceae bacterium]
MSRLPVPELLAPAGSVDALRAAVANGANAVYLGVEKFNARDEGAQLTLDELATSCSIAHAFGARVYLTLNTLVKAGELEEALAHLGDCIDRGIDAAIVQDLGLIRLIQAVYPGFEVHGSTQMTVHDADGARFLHDIGVGRVVLARENTLDDIQSIRAAVPDLSLESFVHGALCISYSGQCLMSGMISERSANRGSCAQACRKDYVLTDSSTGEELDRGYLISARDLAAHEHLVALARAGIVCLKVEGRKKKPEYVATVTRGYRQFLDRVAAGETAAPTFDDVRPLVQIYSRGFTGGMYGGRAGRDYVTRTQPDNRGHEIGVVVGREQGSVVIEVTYPVSTGDGLGFEPPDAAGGAPIGGVVSTVRELPTPPGSLRRQAVTGRFNPPVGWRVVRSAQAALVEAARQSYQAVAVDTESRTRLDARCFGSAGAPLKVVFTAGSATATVSSEVPLVPAQARPLDDHRLREQLGRLGETPFVLGALDIQGMDAGLFLPVSEINRVRQRAVEELITQRSWQSADRIAERKARIEQAVGAVRTPVATDAQQVSAFQLIAEVFQVEDAVAALDHGATVIAFDPFLRHPMPPVARLRALHERAQSERCHAHVAARLSFAPRSGTYWTSGWGSTCRSQPDTPGWPSHSLPLAEPSRRITPPTVSIRTRPPNSSIVESRESRHPSSSPSMNWRPSFAPGTDPDWTSSCTVDQRE